MTVIEKNVKKTVCIRYDLSDRKVSVLSDIYLKKFFKGKKVENISGYSDDLSKAAGIILSIIFIVLNIAASLISFLFELQLLPNLIISAVLTVIYIISAVIIENKREISEFKILFIQFGGLYNGCYFSACDLFCFNRTRLDSDSCYYLWHMVSKNSDLRTDNKFNYTANYKHCKI
ncbi:MAG: hypothetical protein HDT21_09505 [Ruminococcus sp.]|nr:hypothetical protein [Ruminococcus sp.]